MEGSSHNILTQLKDIISVKYAIMHQNWVKKNDTASISLILDLYRPIAAFLWHIFVQILKQIFHITHTRLTIGSQHVPGQNRAGY